MRLWHKHYSQAEYHEYVNDLQSLQYQRSQAINAGNTEEAERYDAIIELAQLVAERILENMKGM